MPHCRVERSSLILELGIKHTPEAISPSGGPRPRQASLLGCGHSEARSNTRCAAGARSERLARFARPPYDDAAAERHRGQEWINRRPCGRLRRSVPETNVHHAAFSDSLRRRCAEAERLTPDATNASRLFETGQ